MLINYETMFGSKPKEYSTPLAEKYHMELDNSELLDDRGNKQYQSLIGALQWFVTLGRFDIHLGIATMSSFRVAPCQGHLECLKRMYGYLSESKLVLPDFVQRSLIMKQLLLPLSMTGVLPSMVMSKRNFLLICQHLEVSLGKLLPIKMLIFIMTLSLAGPCPASFTLSIRRLLHPIARNKRLYKQQLMVLNLWLHAMHVNRLWISVILYV
jgi:hypothetical protein